ncbi:MAG: hypothetical protein KGL39_06845 [Patescibacteria group bacterium]|nr:hypothetical protein [Patescibacteria group bacterium]
MTTRAQKAKYLEEHGVEGCFQCWGGAIDGTHVCGKPRGHSGPCRCHCGTESLSTKRDHFANAGKMIGAAQPRSEQA